MSVAKRKKMNNYFLYIMKRKVYQTRLYNENKRKRQRELGYLSISKGDETEKFVAEVMKKFKYMEDVQVIGNTGSFFDILYKYENDEYRCLQVKTLVKDLSNNDTWRVTFDSNYMNDTLIVLVNEDRDRFGLISFGSVTTKSLSLGFRRMKKGKYRYNKYNNIISFSESLYRRSKISSIFDIEKSFSSSIRKEFDSLQRLSEKCREYGFSFSKSESNGSVVDCVINNKNIQCKYSSLIKGNYCRFNLCKSNGRFDTQPYDENDLIDYFIFEVGEYKGSFYIIPKNVLIEKGYLRSEKNKGIKSISLCLPDAKYHWTKKFWNKFLFLK